MDSHPVEPRPEDPVGEQPVLGTGEGSGPEPASAGHLQFPGAWYSDGGVDGDLSAAADEAAIGDAGEVNAAALAHDAVRAVGANKELGGELVAPARAPHAGGH